MEGLLQDIRTVYILQSVSCNGVEREAMQGEADTKEVEEGDPNSDMRRIASINLIIIATRRKLSMKFS